jgi:hypothetical protein
VRRSNYRLVLPEGPLRRFRLPESFGDEVRGAKQAHPIPVMAGVGWLGVCFCSWSLAAGVVDPAAFFDRTWQLPSEESGRTLVAGMLAPAHADAEVVARPQAAPRQSAAQPALAGLPTSGASHRLLPKVTFPDVQAHSGGWGAPNGVLQGDALAQSNALAESEIASSPGTNTADDLGSTRSAVAGERKKSSLTDDGGFNLGQMVRELVADTPGALPRPVSPPSSDPFEADFASVSLPRLNSAHAPDAPVAMRPRDVPSGEQAPTAPEQAPRRASSGERGTLSWNGGCQRAFDASVQSIGAKPASTDATRADYARVLGRLDVAGCGPRAQTRIEVCVAVDEGRAVGATVHTTPSTPALGECLLRKVRSLGFPASGGTDLVRTHYQVD